MSWLISQPLLLNLLIINVLLAFSQYVTLRAGVFSAATVGIQAVAAYAAAFAAVNWSWPFWATLLLAMVSGTAVSVVLGLPIARLRGIFQAVATLGFVIVVQSSLFNLTSITGGAPGLSGIPRYATTLHLVVALGVVVYVLSSMNTTRLGAVYDAIRLDEVAASSLGFSIKRNHMKVFALSGWMAGLSGGLFAHVISALVPQMFGFSKVIAVIAFVIIGGSHSIWGPVFGAVLLTLLPELIRPVGDNRLIAEGLLLILVMIYLPEGIVDNSLARVRSLRMRRSLAKEG